MNPIDFPASFQNLENMNKIQQREVSNPLMFSMRNSIEDDKRLEEQLHKVNESEGSEENKKINPEEERKRREEEQEKRKKEEQKKEKKKTGNRGVRSGRFVDFSV